MAVEEGDEVFEDIRGEIPIFFLFFLFKVIFAFLSLENIYLLPLYPLFL